MSETWSVPSSARAGLLLVSVVAKLATALLDGTAPGMAALDSTTPTLQDNTPIGDFLATSTWQNGQTVTWRSSQTGGYTSYFGLDRAHHKAVVVLSDVAAEANTHLGI
jgi:hypothetical protein